MRKIEIPIYLFEELKADAQTVAVNKIIEAYCIDGNEIPEDMKEDFTRAVARSEDLRTPWFFSQIFFETCSDKIVRECKKFEYYSTGIPYAMIYNNKEG